MAKGAIFHNTTDAVSGSIKKLVMAPQACIENVQYGTYDPESNAVNSSGFQILETGSRDIQLSGSFELEGPIAGFKLFDGAVVAIFNDL
jgi:hypothetical protein